MGRFVFYNPHGYWFKKTVYGHFNPQLAVFKKYQWIWDYFYSKSEKACVYVNSHETTLQGDGHRNFWKWALLNKINPFKIELIRNIRELQADDILFFFQLGNLNLQYEPFIEPSGNINELSSCKAFKVMHLSHYGYHAKEASKYAQMAKVDLFVSESNLAKNSQVFSNYYPWYKKDVFVLPFLPEDRFIPTANFNERINKALATGQTQNSPSDISRDFGIEALHPTRKMIFDNAHELSDVIDSRISRYIPCGSCNKQSIVARIINRIVSSKVVFWVHFFIKLATSKIGASADKKQNKIFGYDYDIVALMNKYKMVVHGKECIDLPPISAFEAIACGCVLIAEHDGMYDDMGFKDGVSYVSFDGSVDDLKRKIRYFQDDPNALERISVNGQCILKKIPPPHDLIKKLIAHCHADMEQKNA